MIALSFVVILLILGRLLGAGCPSQQFLTCCGTNDCCLNPSYDHCCSSDSLTETSCGAGSSVYGSFWGGYCSRSQGTATGGGGGQICTAGVCPMGSGFADPQCAALICADGKDYYGADLLTCCSDLGSDLCWDYCLSPHGDYTSGQECQCVRNNNFAVCCPVYGDDRVCAHYCSTSKGRVDPDCTSWCGLHPGDCVSPAVCDGGPSWGKATVGGDWFVNCCGTIGDTCCLDPSYGNCCPGDNINLNSCGGYWGFGGYCSRNQTTAKGGGGGQICPGGVCHINPQDHSPFGDPQCASLICSQGDHYLGATPGNCCDDFESSLCTSFCNSPSNAYVQECECLNSLSSAKCCPTHVLGYEKLCAYYCSTTVGKADPFCQPEEEEEEEEGAVEEEEEEEEEEGAEEEETTEEAAAEAAETTEEAAAEAAEAAAEEEEEAAEEEEESDDETELETPADCVGNVDCATKHGDGWTCVGGVCKAPTTPDNRNQSPPKSNAGLIVGIVVPIVVVVIAVIVGVVVYVVYKKKKGNSEGEESPKANESKANESKEPPKTTEMEVNEKAADGKTEPPETSETSETEADFKV